MSFTVQMSEDEPARPEENVPAATDARPDHEDALPRIYAREGGGYEVDVPRPGRPAAQDDGPHAG